MKRTLTLAQVNQIVSNDRGEPLHWDMPVHTLGWVGWLPLLSAVGIIIAALSCEKP